MTEMGLHSPWEQHLQAKGTGPAGEVKGAPAQGTGEQGLGLRILKRAGTPLLGSQSLEIARGWESRLGGPWTHQAAVRSYGRLCLSLVK